MMDVCHLWDDGQPQSLPRRQQSVEMVDAVVDDRHNVLAGEHIVQVDPGWMVEVYTTRAVVLVAEVIIAG